MSVPRFSNEFFDAVTADIHCRTAASRKRRFGGQVNVSACFRGRQLGRYRRFRVFQKVASPRVNAPFRPPPGAPPEKTRAKTAAKGPPPPLSPPPCHPA